MPIKHKYNAKNHPKAKIKAQAASHQKWKRIKFSWAAASAAQPHGVNTPLGSRGTGLALGFAGAPVFPAGGASVACSPSHLPKHAPIAAAGQKTATAPPTNPTRAVSPAASLLHHPVV